MCVSSDTFGENEDVFSWACQVYRAKCLYKSCGEKRNTFYVPNASSVNIGLSRKTKATLQLHFWAYIAVGWSENVVFLL